jgi:hypothetical protein
MVRVLKFNVAITNAADGAISEIFFNQNKSNKDVLIGLLAGRRGKW